jgi:hypothetical protein
LHPVNTHYQDGTLSCPNVIIMKNCLECDKAVVGRVDKKFCSDMCRSSYNNRLNSDSHPVIRNVNNQLRKNRRILEELCPADKSKITKTHLDAKGFDFNLLTSIRSTLKGNVYYFVYDYGYLKLDHDYYLIVKDRRSEK